MALASTRQSLETIGRLGEEWLARIYPTLDPTDEGKFVVVDTLSGESEVDEDELVAAQRLRQRCPSAEPFLGRFGHTAAYTLWTPAI